MDRGTRIPSTRRCRKPARGLVLIAIISDLHSNIEALEVAMKDIESLGVETVVCLGDVIGYGASPREVIELVKERCRLA